MPHAGTRASTDFVERGRPRVDAQAGCLRTSSAAAFPELPAIPPTGAVDAPQV